MGRRSLTVIAFVALVLAQFPVLPAAADTTAQALPFSQDWSNTGLITTNDDWSGVPGIIGYRGDGLAAAPGANPQTITADGSATPVDVNANQTNPNTFVTGGVSEFHLSNPVVALQGSGTADAPHLVLTLDTSGTSSITVAYNLRDIDGSADNAIQPIALQYRVGMSGSYTNLPAGFVADATTGPSLATQVTPVAVTLPADANNQPIVQVRIITTDAAGSDEWVGVDDVAVIAGGPPADAAPFVAATTPANGATEVPTNSNITITFSEPVNAGAGAFALTCTRSGGVTLTVTPSGASTTYVLDPQSDLQRNEVCTVMTEADAVTDVDEMDPPDNMAADHTFSFSTTGLALRIHDIQGAQHLSPYDASFVSQVPGVVTAIRSNGFWIQDPQPDADVRTSEGIFVFTDGAPTTTLGSDVRVSGRVQEFRPGCPPPCDSTSGGFANLTTTEIVVPTTATVGVGTISPTVVGLGGRVPPTRVIENDSAGNVETSNTFDPARDGIDFYESLEGMLVQINDAVAIGPRNDFGEVPVLSDNGSYADIRTTRGGIIVRKLGSAQPPHDYEQGDFNPERLILDDVIRPTPRVDVRDRFTTPIRAVVDYSFGNFKFLVLNDLVAVDGGLAREQTQAARPEELAVASFNVENLDPTDTPAKFAALAELIVQNLRSPDLLAIEEVQDNTGPSPDPSTDAAITWQTLIAAIQTAGGPTYDYRQIDPLFNQDGGEPGGNIRQGFLFRTDRGLSFVDRPGGTAVTETHEDTGSPGAQLTFSPGRIQPNDSAFANSRKPLAGEFQWRGETFFAIANHFNSKGGDDPLFGRFQPPIRRSEIQRHQQARIVNEFVDELLVADRRAKIIVLGDFNDFEFSKTLDILKGDELVNLMDRLPRPERYSYVFDGNSQTLDQILVSSRLVRSVKAYDSVHVNAEFADQDSDHDPQVARLRFGSSGDDGDLGD